VASSAADCRERFGRRASGPLVWGHRGASLAHPENTLRALAAALDAGADGVELDVRRCGSGEVVLMHDPTLARTAGDPRRVAEVSFEVLRGLDVGGGERVPTLHEALDLVRGRDRLLDVEVKADDDDRGALCAAVTRTLRARSPADRAGVMLSTFDPRALVRLLAWLPDVPVALLFDASHTGRVLRYLGPALPGVRGVNPEHVLCTPASVARWRRAGLLVTPWTVDDPARLRELAGMGVDGVITNDPAAARAALRR
jgi:glycerophosphoryl diester phosphodiesterase